MIRQHEVQHRRGQTDGSAAQQPAAGCSTDPRVHNAGQRRAETRQRAEPPEPRRRGHPLPARRQQLRRLVLRAASSTQSETSRAPHSTTSEVDGVIVRLLVLLRLPGRPNTTIEQRIVRTPAAWGPSSSSYGRARSLPAPLPRTGRTPHLRDRGRTGRRYTHYFLGFLPCTLDVWAEYCPRTGNAA